MSVLVLDASVAAAWLFDDEDEPRADAALRRIESEIALVPQLWHLELALRCEGALATLDAALAQAAVAEGLALVEPMNPPRQEPSARER